RRQAFFTAEQHHHRARFLIAQALGLFAMPIPLSGPQFLAITNAAAALFPSDRDSFIAAVAAALEGQPIGDGIIGRIIRDVQRRFAQPDPGHARPRWGRAPPALEQTSKPYWAAGMSGAAAQLRPQGDTLALLFLRQAGFKPYAPRLRECRPVRGRKVAHTP